MHLRNYVNCLWHQFSIKQICSNPTQCRLFLHGMSPETKHIWVFVLILRPNLGEVWTQSKPWAVRGWKLVWMDISISELYKLALAMHLWNRSGTNVLCITLTGSHSKQRLIWPCHLLAQILQFCCCKNIFIFLYLLVLLSLKISCNTSILLCIVSLNVHRSMQIQTPIQYIATVCISVCYLFMDYFPEVLPYP